MHGGGKIAIFDRNRRLFSKRYEMVTIDDYSVVISRPWSRDSSALEFILSRSRSRSRSRDLKSKVTVLVSRPRIGLGLETACLVPTPVARSLAQTLSICHL